MDSEASPFRSPETSIGSLDARTAARVIAASSDVALVLDRDGVVRDFAVSDPSRPTEALAPALNRRWAETVTPDSRHKVEEMLAAAAGDGETRWRQVNQETASGQVPMRCLAMELGADGRMIVFARDLTREAELQTSLLKAQIEAEREYLKLRQAEGRYRILFELASEGVLVVDSASRRIVEANAAAASALGAAGAPLPGQTFQRLFHPESRDAASALLRDANGAVKPPEMRLRAADGRHELIASSSQFRQDGGAQILVRLNPAKPEGLAEPDARQRLVRIVNRFPDAFVAVDGDMNVLECNLAFLELAQVSGLEAVKNHSLGRYLGRPGADLAVLRAALAQYGSVRGFITAFTTAFGAEEDVQVSAVSVGEGLESCYGLIVRPVRRPASADARADLASLTRTPEQLKELVGRMSLKDIVRQTTDVIERLCIEAALGLTKDNRASASELLGLSRQSLYSKLRRYGLDGGDEGLDASD